MMRKDPAERPPNLQSAMRALEEAAGVESVSDVPLSRRTPSALTPMPPRRASTEPPRRNSDTAFAHTIDVAPSISAPAPWRSRWWIAGVLGVLVAGGIAAAVLAGDSTPTPTAAQPAPITSPEPAPAIEAAPAAAAPAVAPVEEPPPPPPVEEAAVVPKPAAKPASKPRPKPTKPKPVDTPAPVPAKPAFDPYARH